MVNEFSSYQENFISTSLWANDERQLEQDREKSWLIPAQRNYLSGISQRFMSFPDTFFYVKIWKPCLISSPWK